MTNATPHMSTKIRVLTPFFYIYFLFYLGINFTDIIIRVFKFKGENDSLLKYK